MKHFINEIFPETFDYTDKDCVKIAVQNYCKKHNIQHLEEEICKEIFENF